MGSYNPKTGLLYKVGNEWCMDLEVMKTDADPRARWRSSTSARSSPSTHPKADKAHGHMSRARPDHRQGEVGGRVPASRRWRACCRPGGNLLFVPDARGWLRAYDATTGKELWKHNNGQGHNGGIISYTAKGKQYVAVMTGWGGLAGDDYAAFFGGPFAQMPKDSGVLKVFALP